MALRFTDTQKWKDPWFSDLKKEEKLLFLYLQDNVDNSGIYEISFKRLHFELDFSEAEILGAIKGLARGLVGVKEGLKTCDKIYLKNFLKYQKNLPLNPFNSYHWSAIKAFAENYEFICENPFIANLPVVGIKKNREGKILEDVKTTLKVYLENQGLASPIVIVKGIVKGEVEVKGKGKGTFEKSEKLLKENSTQIEIYPTGDDFWILFDKKIGNETKIKNLFAALEHPTRIQIIENHLPKYIKATPNKKFRVNPLKYIEEQYWNNEIIPNNDDTDFTKTNEQIFKETVNSSAARNYKFK